MRSQMFQRKQTAIAAFAFDNDLADMPVFPDANGSMRPLSDFQPFQGS